MSEFKTYHPIVNFIYFFVVIMFSMVFMHPICLFISLLSSVLYGIALKKRNLFYVFSVIIISMLVNPLFNHRGLTIITYLPSGNPLTFESLLFGLASGVMLASVINWFSCSNSVFTSDKFIYLFGKIMPSFSLVFSMVMRFIPRFKTKLKEIINAQKCIGKDVTTGSIIDRAKNAISILSVLITWAFENSIDTADSMKSRGYGLRGRTSFSIYKFDKRDASLLSAILIFTAYVLAGWYFNGFDFVYYPKISLVNISGYNISLYIAYFCLLNVPLVIEIWEGLKWKYLKSKI